MSGARARRRSVPAARSVLRVLPDSSTIERDADPVRIARSLGAVSAVAQELSASPFMHASVVDVDLVDGVNKIDHALGVRPLSLTLALHAPSYGFAWGFDPRQAGNPHPERQSWITVATDDPVTARIVFFASSAGDRRIVDLTGGA